MLCYFAADDAPTQAGWKDEDLDKWYSDTNYYSDGSDIPPDGLSFTGKTLAKEMAALKLPARIGDRGLQKFHWRQNKEFEFNGKEYVSYPPMSLETYRTSSMRPCLRMEHQDTIRA